MDSYLANIYTAAGIASGAAALAVISDKCQNILAASLSFTAGIVPWISLGILFFWPRSMALIITLFLPGSLFLAALLLYSLGKPCFARSIVIGMAATGMLAGIAFSAFIAYAILIGK